MSDTMCAKTTETSRCQRCGSEFDWLSDGTKVHVGKRYFESDSLLCLERQLNAANERIKRLEEELMDVKNKHSVLVADVALYEDRADRIHRLEDRINRAAMAFFRDGSDGHVASQMLQILEEERGKK